MREDHVNDRINDREYFEKFLAERDRRIEERFAAVDRANTVALFELNRRLEHLNNAFARADEVAGKTVTSELYERDRAEDKRRWRTVESWQARLTGGLAVVALIGVSNLVKLWLG